MQLKVALQSLPVAPCTLESSTGFVSSGSSQAPAVQQRCFLQQAGPAQGEGSRVSRAAWPEHLAATLGSHFWFGISIEQKGRVCVCVCVHVSMGVMVYLILIKCLFF